MWRDEVRDSLCEIIRYELKKLNRGFLDRFKKGTARDVIHLLFLELRSFLVFDLGKLREDKVDHQVQDMITRRVKYLELVHDHKMMFPSSEDGRNSVERTLTYVLKQLKRVLRN